MTQETRQQQITPLPISLGRCCCFGEAVQIFLQGTAGGVQNFDTSVDKKEIKSITEKDHYSPMISSPHTNTDSRSFLQSSFQALIRPDLKTWNRSNVAYYNASKHFVTDNIQFLNKGDSLIIVEGWPSRQSYGCKNMKDKIVMRPDQVVQIIDLILLDSNKQRVRSDDFQRYFKYRIKKIRRKGNLFGDLKEFDINVQKFEDRLKWIESLAS